MQPVGPKARRGTAAAWLLLGALLLAACAAGSGTPAVTAGGLPSGTDASVDRVVDGDTIVLDDRTRVRLIGVDTPESVDPRQEVECYGQEAAAFTEELIPTGTRVRLVEDVEPVDQYGRKLAYVWRLEDGLFVNAELLRQGYAQQLTIPPNVARSEEFTALVAEAREAGRGLWSSCQ